MVSATRLPDRSALAAAADAGLVMSGPFIDGHWAESDGSETFDVRNPADDTILASVKLSGMADANAAIAAAEKKLPAWAETPAKQRAQLLCEWHRSLLAKKENLANLITLESGKPIYEAKAEVDYAAAYFQWFGEEAKRLNGLVLPAPTPDRRVLVTREPVGVVACITPWNFPIAMLARKIAPALAAGCTVVAKPSEETPLSAFALMELGRQIGLPAGVVNTLAGEASAIGEAFTSSSAVRKLSFTGSTRVGVALQAACAPTMKRTSMELGGNAPFIVFADADLDAAVAGLMAAKFRNAGQTCICANRVLVENACFDAFVEKLSTAVKGLEVGHGLDEGTSIGPLITRSAAERVSELLAHVRADQIITHHQKTDDGSFVSPALVIEPDEHQPLVQNEIFGPVAPILRFHSDEEAVAKANATPAGLAAYLYTSDRNRQWLIPERLQFGMVGINDAALSNEMAPFGGIKMSGHGREGSVVGLDDYTQYKYLSIGDVT